MTTQFMSFSRTQTGKQESTSLAQAALFVLFVFLPGIAAMAAPVSFDVPSVVECKDVTTDEFAKSNPDEKMVEVRLRISSQVHQWHKQQMAQYTCSFTSPMRSCEVVDFQPRTTLASKIDGPMSVEKKKDKNASVGIGVSGGLAGIAKGNLSLNIA